MRAEVQLSIHPQRADLLLLRRAGIPRRDGEARVLRALWLLLGTDTLIEFKSPVRGFRRTDLLRLVAYGVQYHMTQFDRPLDRSELTLVLVVPSVTTALRDEIALMGWTLTPLGGGYGRIEGGMYTIYVVVTDEVAETEQDDFLRLFSHHPCMNQETKWWWQHWVAEDKAMQDIKTVEGYDEMLRKFLEPLTIEERLLGVAPEQRLLAMPDDALRALSEEYLRALSPDIQQAIRKRIGRPS